MQINDEFNKITITCPCGRTTHPILNNDTFVYCPCGITYRNIKIDHTGVSFGVVYPRQRPTALPSYERVEAHQEVI